MCWACGALCGEDGSEINKPSFSCLDPSSSGAVGCRARPSGRINTQSHCISRWKKSPEMTLGFFLTPIYQPDCSSDTQRSTPKLGVYDMQTRENRSLWLSTDLPERLNWSWTHRQTHNADVCHRSQVYSKVFWLFRASTVKVTWVT